MWETHLDERLDFTSPREFLGSHAFSHLPGVAFDASNDSMGVWALLSTIIELLYDDDLLASLATLENDGNLVSLHRSYCTERKEMGTFPGL
jgi:hypothetical protein